MSVFLDNTDLGRKVDASHIPAQVSMENPKRRHIDRKELPTPSSRLQDTNNVLDETDQNQASWGECMLGQGR